MDTTAAHPRSRGENRPADRLSLQAYGSSPLTRGKLAEGLQRLMGERLIPAHAGKTVASAHMCVDQKAHPRSRGENVSEWCTS